MYGSRGRIGRICPSPETVGVEEWGRILPDEVICITSRMYIEAVDPSGLTRMVQDVERAAAELATARPDLVLMAGTAGAFTGGLGFDRELSQRISSVTGGPATTTMTSVVMALRALELTRFKVVTPYIDTVDKRLQEVLEQSGFAPVSVTGMGILKSIDMGDLPVAEVRRFVRAAMRDGAPGHGVLICCGNLRSLELIGELEQDFGQPVVTSNQASLWYALTMLGIDPGDRARDRGGRLFQIREAPAP